MNKTYRLIWNRRLNAWIVASELTRASGKKASGRTRAGVAAVVLALGTSLPLAAADLSPGALPTGGTVVAGQADIAASGTRMDITQGSQKAIINWQGFDIGSQAQVNFAQPNASAVALNRVSGPTATRIEGQLTANGQVFLINPNGVLFGNGARVNAGAFVASTLNIGDDDFLAGKYTFTGTGGAIENQGAITAAPGGYLAFIAPKITNAGTLSAPQGTVAMGAGERVTLNFAGDRLVGLSVAAETLDTLIESRQAIRAEGGAILLTAAGAEAVTRSVINNSGVLEAGSLTADGGRIVLTAGNDINLGAGSSVAVDGKKGGEIRLQAQSGTLLADGNLSARGASGVGGSVQLLGRQVGLVNAAQVDASGATGGGTVLVGGDYQGGNAEVANARATYVAPDVTIKANALRQGDGGKVIVWANEIARFYGNISADGAGTGGNGGFVETSGKAVLDASGSVSALGVGGGRAGTWLLDPYDITIQTAGTNTNVTASPSFTSNGNSAIVTTGSIQTALNGGTSVTVVTGAGGAQAGNITVANAINKSAGGNALLTLTAINNIVFNAGADIGATAGQLALTLNAGGTITNPAAINTNGGLLTYNATGAATQSGVVSGAGGVTKAGAGTLTLSGANIYTGTTTINAGTLTASGGSAIADTSQVTLANTAGATLNLANSETIGNLSGGGATGGNVTLGANTLTVNEGGTTTYSGVISGTGGLTKAGTGTLTLSRANSYSGSTTINAGTLALGASNVLANGSSVVVNGGTLNIANRSDTVAGVQLVSGSILGTTGTLTSTTAYDLQSGTVSAQLGGAVGLNKTTSGIVTLSGANSYTGATNINAGTLALGAANRINNASAVTVASGATFNLANFAETVGSLAGAGNVTLGSAILTAGGDNTSTTFSGVASGTGGLTKAGTGALTLSGANTYTGATTINAGTLTASGGSAIADTSQVTLANTAGATLNLANSETIGNLSGGGTTGGNVTLGANTLTVNEAGATTYSGVVSGSGGLTKAGAGTLTVGGINTYTGATSINAGTLALNATGTISASSGVANAGNFSIAAAKTIDSMNGTGTTALGANTLTIGDASNTSSSYTGVINGTGGLVKAGTGVLTLGGANTYTGTTTINAGTLRYGANNAIAGGAVVVNNGGTYDLNNFSDTIGALTVNSGTTGGTVTTGTGTLTLGGNVTSTGGAANATISGNLTLGGATRTFTTTNAADGLTISAAVSGAVGLTKAGGGTLTLSGTNSYSGATTINAGALTAAGGSAIADTSQVTLSNTAGATLNLANSETIGNLSGGGTTGGNVTLGANTLTVNEAGTTTYGGILSGTGGLTKAGSGTLTLSGNNTYTGATNINAGSLALGNNDRIANASAVTVAAGATFNLGNYNETVGSLSGSGTVTKSGTGARTLTVGGDNTSTTFSGVIQQTGTGALSLTKNGTGVLTLSGANTYTGATAINAGTLVAANTTALGTAAGGTTVANGATLALQGGITIGAEALNISGTGVGGDGALRNLSGDNTLGGTLTLAANAEIQSDAGTLTLSAANSVTGATRNLSVDGAGNTTISGTITTTSGTLTKNGTGTLTLSGGNTYTGATAINAGTLAVTANNALGSAAAGTTVGSGATLDFRNVPYATAEAVTLNGGTLAASTGTNSFAGPVTLGANGNVDVGGTQLTLSGVIGGAGFGVAKLGNGTLVLSGSNTYTGATNINAGTLTASGGNAIQDTSQVNLANVAGATLNLAGSETIGNLSGGGAAGGNVTLGANTLTVNQTAATTYAGTISGSGGLTKIGTGTLTLAGPNTYAGVTDINAGMLVAANAAALGGTGGGTNVGSSARLSIDSVALGAEPVTLNGPGLFGTGAITSNGNASLAGPVTLAGDAVIAPNSGSTLTLSGTLNGAFGLTTGGNGTLNLNGAVGGVTPLTFLTTGTSGATDIGTSVRTIGDQTFNNATTLAAGVVLDSTAGKLVATAPVTATAGLVLLKGATGVDFQYSGNDFASVAVTTGGNASLVDQNAIDLGASTIGGSLALTASGNVTGSGAIHVGGSTAINAGASGDIALVNAGNDFGGQVSIVSGNAVALHDSNDLVLNSSTFGTLTATAGGALTLLGAQSASGAGDAIVLSAGRFVNHAGASALAAPSGRWLVWSSNPNPFAGATPDNRGGLAYDFKQYNATYGVTTPAQASGNGFLYALAPTITAGLSGTVNKVYDATTGATLFAGNFTASGGVDGDVIALTGTGAYDNPNVAGSPTKLVTVSGIAASATSSIVEGSKPVYGYTLTSTTASANIGEITPATLTLSAVSDTKIYDATTISNGTATVSGLQGSDSVTGLSQSFLSKNVLGSNGSVLAVNSGYIVNDGSGGNNYTVITNTATGTITPASLVISANDANRPFGTPNPPFSATYVGLVGGETPASLSGTLGFATPATLASPAGSYPITPFGQTSGNYRITYLDGRLLVVGQPIVPPVNAGREFFNPQAVAATYTDQGPMLVDVPVLRYVAGQGDTSPGMQRSNIRIVDGGLNVGR